MICVYVVYYHDYGYSRNVGVFDTLDKAEAFVNAGPMYDRGNYDIQTWEVQ